ncbi:uncharacterized protein [Anoplolepis gracilipes]|uniref:uncharacterized protein n=1 Tax=Anoplolepis gracilipes TaxID=354296 RepID=UPI003BA30148
MRVLEFTFKILTICGCWTPNSWTSSYRCLLYHVYTIFIFVLISTFTLSQFLDLILIVDNPDDFTDNFYMLLAMIVSCFKMSSLLLNRSNIAMLTDTLMKKPCIPIEPDEMKIRRKFDRIIELNTLHYAILVEFSSSYSVIQSLFTDYWERKLTFRAWLPFDYSSTILFHIMYFHQLIALLVGALLHVACDSLICGLILHICCQIEILSSRLKRIIRNPKILRDYVVQHNLMIKFAFTVNEKFRLIITFQFIVSTLVVCVTLYQLTKTNAKVIQLALYMSCMLTQIFLYCWYGNEVKLKSMQLINNLFEIEWVTLGEDVKKDLLTITRCGTVPIEFTSAYIFPMNLDSFVGLLKTSYSTYNILKQMREENAEVKMHLLGFTFKILISCGCWIPKSWTVSFYRRFIYHIYTIFILLLINTFTLSQFLDIILIVDNPEDFMDNFYMLLAMIVSCFKMYSLLINRNNIAMLIDILMSGPCKPLEPAEIEIRQKFDKLIETNTLHYMILVELTCVSTAVASLLTDYKKEKLTFRAWLPFDYYSSATLFHFTYFHQLISLTVGSVLHVACDGIICGLLLHICCQIEILSYRLKNIMRNPRTLRDCVIQHNLIIKFAYLLNKKFRFTISFQFLVSTLVVCFTLYQLTKTSEKFVELGMYMSCMLTQIFLYCWYGNEVKLKSLQLINDLYEIKSFTLGRNIQKDLLTITIRSQVPIEFSSAYVIPMNVDSFMSLLKTSYSTYNILQQMQDPNK